MRSPDKKWQWHPVNFEVVRRSGPIRIELDFIWTNTMYKCAPRYVGTILQDSIISSQLYRGRQPRPESPFEFHPRAPLTMISEIKKVFSLVNLFISFLWRIDFCFDGVALILIRIEVTGWTIWIRIRVEIVENCTGIRRKTLVQIYHWCKMAKDKAANQWSVFS